MAKKVAVSMVDDLDGTESPDIRTIDFGLDGVTYTIDLTTRNHNRLHDLLAEYVRAARRVGARGRRSPRAAPSKPPTNRDQTRAVRDWARRNGHAVSDRGRIPAAITEAFDEAHQRRTQVAAPSRTTTTVQLPRSPDHHPAAMGGRRP